MRRNKVPVEEAAQSLPSGALRGHVYGNTAVQKRFYVVRVCSAKYRHIGAGIDDLLRHVIVVTGALIEPYVTEIKTLALGIHHEYTVSL